jgi:hypothetical protein
VNINLQNSASGTQFILLFKIDTLLGNCLSEKLISVLFGTSFTQICENLVINAKFQFYVKFTKLVQTQSKQFKDHDNEIRIEARQ